MGVWAFLGVLQYLARFGVHADFLRDATALPSHRPIAPDIVRALLDGLQPIELTPTRLIRLSKDLPHEWSEQRHFLGFGEGRSMSSDRNAL